MPCFALYTQLTATNIEKIAVNRIQDGRLTIVFKEHELDQITLSLVKNKQDLRRCCDIIDRITSPRSHLHAVMSTGSTPPTSVRESSQAMSGSAKRKLQLNL